MMDTLMSPTSKQFIKPNDVFKLRKKKRLTLSTPQSISSSPAKPINTISPSKVPAFSPLKCLQNLNNSPIRDGFSPLRLRKTPTKSRIRNSFPIVKRSPISPRKSSGKRKLSFLTVKETDIHDDVFLINNDENANLEPAIAINRDESHRSIRKPSPNTYLIDWSLKTKLRFTSRKPFPWRGNFRASEEATGTSSFSRCFHDRLNLRSESSQPAMIDCMNDSFSNTQLDTSWSSMLRHHCLVWSHPNLPWLSLFPRTPDNPPGTPLAFKPPSFSISPNTPLADALHSDWSNSLKSLYQLLKAKQCPYFYMCANSFTVLFRASGVAACDDVQVIMSHTTSGLRNLLTQEGINFIMPLQNESSSDIPCQASLNAIDDEKPTGDENENGEEEEPDAWLESLGLSQQDFPSSCQPKRKKLKSVNAVTRKRSLIVIKGMSDSQLLINFLMNSRFCVPKSGPLSAIPPTLLSPIAFHGATLQPLKLRHAKVEHHTSNQQLYSLEISGPILPNSVYGLVNLFKTTQDQTFKACSITYDSTIPFSIHKSLNMNRNMFTSSIAFATENLKDCGLDREFLNYVCSDQHQSHELISEIECDNKVINFS